MTALRIKSMTATQDGQLTVSFRPNTVLVSSSDTIHMALATALQVDAPLEVETFDQTNVIRRVNAFELRRQPRPGTISRLATQRNPDTGTHVLEVFVLVSSTEEIQVRTHDAAIQRLCHVAALSGERFVFEEKDRVLTSVTVMEKPV